MPTPARRPTGPTPPGRPTGPDAAGRGHHRAGAMATRRRRPLARPDRDGGSPRLGRSRAAVAGLAAGLASGHRRGTGHPARAALLAQLQPVGPLDPTAVGTVGAAPGRRPRAGHPCSRRHRHRRRRLPGGLADRPVPAPGWCRLGALTRAPADDSSRGVHRAGGPADGRRSAPWTSPPSAGTATRPTPASACCAAAWPEPAGWSGPAAPGDRACARISPCCPFSIPPPPPPACRPAARRLHHRTASATCSARPRTRRSAAASRSPRCGPAGTAPSWACWSGCCCSAGSSRTRRWRPRWPRSPPAEAAAAGLLRRDGDGWAAELDLRPYGRARARTGGCCPTWTRAASSATT